VNDLSGEDEAKAYSTYTDQSLSAVEQVEELNQPIIERRWAGCFLNPPIRWPHWLTVSNA